MDAKKAIYVAFDFSMNKPAMTAYYDGKLYFYFWPARLDEKKCEKYRKCGVVVKPRGLPPVDTKHMENTQIVLVHTIRSTDLANLILEDLDTLIKTVIPGDEVELYVCSEGLSFDSRGDASLNLATYKGVLLSKIYEHFGDSLKRLFTYPPITLKATAGCATKELRWQKTAMIDAFCNQGPDIPLKTAIADKDLLAKTKFIDGVDDLVDSYWALMTMIKKENLYYPY